MAGSDNTGVIPDSARFLLAVRTAPKDQRDRVLCAVDRPLRVSRRRDLSIAPLSLRGRAYWHVKDPLTLRYWQLGDEELFLWQQLDGTVSLREWQSRFQQRFAPRRIELRELQGLLGMLHREGLILSDTTGQAETLLQRDTEQQRQRWLGRIANPLAIRFRGIHPGPLLARLEPAVAWLFHPLAVFACLLLMLSAILLVLVEWSRFTARLPEAQAFLAAENLIWLAVALAGAKICHELAHATACQHYGGQCHEMGVMLLVFTPCLYCNVTDVWLIPSKWQRIAVSAAGMFAELLLAACATWLWWWSAPGALNSLCLSLMVVCSASTLVFNGNPLLRYDGYYIFSDWLEIPNLSAAATAQLNSCWKRYVLGAAGDDEWNTDAPGRVWLIIYAVLSWAYRGLVVVLVLWFLWAWFAARRLSIVGEALIGMVVLGMAITWLIRMRQFMATAKRDGIRPGRLLAVATMAAAAGGLLLSVPLPYTIYAPATVRPSGATAVYVTVPGRLLENARLGSVVRRGDPIARLSRTDLESEVIRLTGELAIERQQLDSLRRQQVQDTRSGVSSSGGKLAILEQSAQDLARQLEQRNEELAQLVVRAPEDGVLLAPAARPYEVNESDLPYWCGTPLDPGNLGCTLDAGTLLGYVGDKSQREVLVLVDQAHVADLKLGQRVQVQLDELPGQFLTGRVSSLATLHSEDVPPELIAKRQIPVTGGRDGQPRALGTRFAVQVDLDESCVVPYGSSGEARIRVTSRTLVRRIGDSLYRVFGFGV